MAFSIFGIENLALGEFKVGLILLSLLFFYDIFWVFYTPVMVSVAKNIEGPVKLMFPKLQEAIEQMRKEKGEDNQYAGKAYDPREYNMIGLGDIVIPGIYVALMLRFDIYLYKKAKKDISKFGFSFKNMKYFLVTFIFYNIGIITTLSVMYFFNHAQPALLYLVPCTLISSTFTALLNKDIKTLWKFNEEKIGEEEDDDGSSQVQKLEIGPSRHKDETEAIRDDRVPFLLQQFKTDRETVEIDGCISVSLLPIIPACNVQAAYELLAKTWPLFSSP